MLAFEDEQVVGSARVRWVRAPRHMADARCGCGDAFAVMMVSGGGAGLWWPAVVQGLADDRAEMVAEVFEHESDAAVLGAAKCSAAFGLEWETLTLRLVHAQVVLGDALEDETLDVLRGLDPEGLLELRKTCPEPAHVVRALRLMREYGARTQ